MFINKIKNNIVKIHDDGSIYLNRKFFSYSTGLKMTNDKLWEKLFGLKRLEPDSNLNQTHHNLAYAIQNVTEEIVLKMAKYAKKITQSDNICLSGGVALNCVANGKLIEQKIFKNVYIQPASEGTGVIAGGAVRAVLESVGIQDVLSKSQGSSNPHNVVKATFNALFQLRDANKVAQERGISLEKVFNG